MNERDAIKELTRLFDEAQADLCLAEILLVDLWRETKDPRIEEFFRHMGGLMIDGKYMFGE